MDLWQLIERDHENIAHLIRDIPYALNGSGVVRSRERLLGNLIDEFEAHSAALEGALYAPLRRHEATAGLVDALHREHRTVLKGLTALARRRSSTAGWLDAFEDATFHLDQHLHRHGHELLPAARTQLSSEAIEAAGRDYIRARMKALKGRRGVLGRLGSEEVGLIAVVGALAAGVGYLAWRSGSLGTSGSRRHAH
ncbi:MULTISPECIES: hemerythrin domain-containing protein [Methylobacterium]|uniref:hemerythrin domain-containing protein n=1 Tax=Methylobacterium TaxID=407 RepID=UPI001048FEE3|nr:MULTISPECIES: hemerythrin domain-containing protein [Methylobacterium]MDR7038736.1 hypothetical protein [Methylobacterium sp. BE186]